MACTRSGQERSQTEGPFGGTGGRNVSGGVPEAFHWPKYFSMTDFAPSGVIFPMTTIVVRSGLKTLV